MIAEIGAFACCLALALSLAQGAFGLYASRRDSRAAAVTAISQAASAACFIAFACLIAAFVRSDFSVAVVANNSHVDKPLLYKIAGAWGNHEGSMLLWCTVSAFFGAVLQVLDTMDPQSFSTLIGAKWFPVFLIGFGVLLEYARKRRDPELK